MEKPTPHRETVKPLRASETLRTRFILARRALSGRERGCALGDPLPAHSHFPLREGDLDMVESELLFDREEQVAAELTRNAGHQFTPDRQLEIQGAVSESNEEQFGLGLARM